MVILPFEKIWNSRHDYMYYRRGRVFSLLQPFKNSHPSPQNFFAFMSELNFSLLLLHSSDPHPPILRFSKCSLANYAFFIICLGRHTKNTMAWKCKVYRDALSNYKQLAHEYTAVSIECASYRPE